MRPSYLVLLFTCALSLFAQTPPDPFSGIRLRSVGPAMTSGRVTSFAVDTGNPSLYYVGVASGGVWKTVNAGVTYSPVFDNEGSYSIGHIALDPRNANIVWVGTGENNSQRSVSYGDGVYRSEDGGKSWRNVGLKSSEHIGRIAIHPENTDTVFVAAQGPLWSSGGDRGLYKTTDAGKTWTKVLDISEDTGVTDVAFSPHHPKIMLAASWQRRRHVYTLLNGGPETALYRSTDGGTTWNKVRGLPNEDMGRIGVSFSPAEPCLAYARVEAANQQSGIFRSTDCGATWEKRSRYDGQGMYYGQIIADPIDPQRIYLGDVYAKRSEDGGRTLANVGDRNKHVDTHTFWIDPRNNQHLLSGCDGGVYESYDRGLNWNFKANIPTMQFYDVTVDNVAPIYNIYGGTQDNWSLGGPSRTRSVTGIVNADWFVTNGGDGFHSRVDSNDPNTIYATSQYGGLVRFDRRTGERVGIQPVEAKGEPPLRWNWDSPLLISPHQSSRIYFAANRLYRSDDRGGAWRAVSPDLTRQLDRDKLPIMGRIWPPDSVSKHQSTSLYGNITALTESPKKEGLLIAGTDDGLIQISEDNGSSWRKTESFPGVPDRTYVARVLASQHNGTTLYAVLNNHKSGDFKPYLLKSTDTGRTWTSISGNLPVNGPTWAIAEDHIDPNLLFAGTEYGLFFTRDGGRNWSRLKGGLPTIAVRDLAIQKRESDLVLATFGRGFYVLDDYSPLRAAKDDTLNQEATLFTARNAHIFVPSQPLGGPGKSGQGESYFAAENPPFGAIFTYHLKDGYRSAKQQRQQAEKKAFQGKQDFPYPTKEQLSQEAEQEDPAILLTVTDSAGKLVRRVAGPAAKGFHRVAWDLKTPPYVLTPPRPPGADEDSPFSRTPSGHFVKPGVYQVALAKRINGVVTPLGKPQSFTVEGPASVAAQADFLSQVIRLERSLRSATDSVTAARQKVTAMLAAIQDSTAALTLRDEARGIGTQLSAIQKALTGDAALAARYEALPPSIRERVSKVASNYRNTTIAPLQTDLDSHRIATTDLAAQWKLLRPLLESTIPQFERKLEAAGVPYTPGRIIVPVP
jgi:photosystem II stability/assembly factor-like uncharacterized protein